MDFKEDIEFQKWLDAEGWFPVNDDEYDNDHEPNSCFRHTIAELYLIYTGDYEKHILKELKKMQNDSVTSRQK